MDEKRNTARSFWKGVLAGACMMAVLTVLLVSFGVLSYQIFRQNMQNKSEPQTAEEVVVNARIKDKMEKIAEMLDEEYIDDVDPEQLENYIYKGMLAGTEDIYSGYYSAEEWTQYQQESSGSYSGVGITMQFDTAKNMAKIVSINPKGPAAKVDIKEDDYIYKVNGEVIEIENGDTTELVSKIRGVEGTKVRITLLRGASSEEIEVEVERKKLEVETVTSQMLENHIGYIHITQFEGLTAKAFEKAYQQLEREGARGLIVDLRDNPGGQVDSVCEIADNFLPKGTITYTIDSKGNRMDYPSTDKEAWNKPLVVLVNSNSASASEIFAGAVRDYGVGTLIGTKTFGKGIVQRFLPMSDGSAIKITFAKYYTPDGENIHGKGIEPDIEIEYEEPEDGAEYDINEDNQVLEAIDNLKEQLGE